MNDTAPPTAAAGVTVVYDLTTADLRTIRDVRRRVVRAARLPLWLLLFAFPAVVCGLVLTVRQDGVAGVGVKDWLLLGIVTLALVLQFPAGEMFLTAPGGRRRRLEVGAEGVTGVPVHGNGGRRVLAWDSPLLGRYAEQRDAFVLLSGDRRARCSFLLPKRALAAPGDVDRLRVLLDAHLARV